RGLTPALDVRSNEAGHVRALFVFDLRELEAGALDRLERAPVRMTPTGDPTPRARESILLRRQPRIAGADVLEKDETAAGTETAAKSRSRSDTVSTLSRQDRFLDWRSGQARRQLCVHRLRLLRGPVVRQVPGLQRLRDARRGGGRRWIGREGAAAAAASPGRC